MKCNSLTTSVAISLLVCLANGCRTSTPAIPPAPEWQFVEYPNNFSMYLPPDMREVPVQGIDSFVGVWESVDTKLQFDLGAYNASPERTKKRDPGLQSTSIVIDGRMSTLFSPTTIDGKQRITLYIPLGKSVIGPSSLAMYFTYSSPEDEEAGKEIFKSVRFLKR